MDYTPTSKTVVNRRLRSPRVGLSVKGQKALWRCYNRYPSGAVTTSDSSPCCSMKRASAETSSATVLELYRAFLASGSRAVQMSSSTHSSSICSVKSSGTRNNGGPLNWSPFCNLGIRPVAVMRRSLSNRRLAARRSDSPANSATKSDVACSPRSVKKRFSRLRTRTANHAMKGATQMPTNAKYFAMSYRSRTICCRLPKPTHKAIGIAIAKVKMMLNGNMSCLSSRIKCPTGIVRGRLQQFALVATCLPNLRPTQGCRELWPAF